MGWSGARVTSFSQVFLFIFVFFLVVFLCFFVCFQFYVKAKSEGGDCVSRGESGRGLHVPSSGVWVCRVFCRSFLVFLRV